MVNLGWLVGLGTAAAVGIGAYALWVNRAAIGGALSRGIAVNVSNPIGEYFENLFNGSNGNGENRSDNPPVADPNPNPDNDFVPCSNNPADYRTWCNGYIPPPDQDFLPPRPNPEPEPEPEAPEPRLPPPRPEPEPEAPEPPIPQTTSFTPEPEPEAPEPQLPPVSNPVNTSNENLLPGANNENFYYIDFIGDRMDQQLPISADHAAELAGATNVRAVYNLGTSRPLSLAAFELFGRSKNAYGV